MGEVSESASLDRWILTLDTGAVVTVRSEKTLTDIYRLDSMDLPFCWMQAPMYRLIQSYCLQRQGRCISHLLYVVKGNRSILLSHQEAVQTDQVKRVEPVSTGLKLNLSKSF